MGAIKAIKKTAHIVSVTGRFCTHPFCLHVAGVAKCSRKCCKKSGK